MERMDFHTEDEKDLAPQGRTSDIRIVTQNVRGFTKRGRWEWLSAWRNTPRRERPAIILLQETHINSHQEKQELERRWNWVWGCKPNTQLSFWSVGDAKQAGVAVLVTPEYQDDVRPWNQNLWSSRVIGVKFKNMHVVNVYAPATNADAREAFFEKLVDWQLAQVSFPVLAGDFNCVESPSLDRLGGNRSERTESEALSRITQAEQLTDARILLGSALSDLELSPTEHYTHWQGEAASRIDRFYIPNSSSKWLQWLQVKLPPVPSDHDEVTLHLRDPKSTGKKKALQRTVYPIRSAQQDLLIDELLRELNGQAQSQPGQATHHWDQWIKTCKQTIKKVTHRAKNRRNRKTKRLQSQLRENPTSRAQLLRTLLEDLRAHNELMLGYRLERKSADIRWLFKKTAIWEREQTVSRIDPPKGVTFTDADTIPERFVKVWEPLMGRRHSSVDPAQMATAVASFARIPDERRVQEQDNFKLMAAISEDDLLGAVADLQRHKAAGADGLNNDFYLDLAPVMVPRLVDVCNQLLNGQTPPDSFLKAVVVPLRKKGDSPNALDYRPISLLQTSYKLFAKVLATRLQRFLGKLVGSSQQGFVHGRQMDKSVMMMMSQMDTAFADETLEASTSAGILLLDFAKAYDTVDRVYLLEVLRQYGFSEEFVALMKQLHDNTVSQFLVNGELSRPLKVQSGIRQGCPLAPLLFILAAEMLGLAVEQNNNIVGLPVQDGSNAVRHKFSAFVDDSTVFLEQSGQLPEVMTIVTEFGRISGLQVQPAKSKFLFLNSTIKEELWHGIPVLPPGQTTRYLGHEVGNADLPKVNWAKRIRTVQRRMVTAESAVTTVKDRVDLLNAIVLPSVLFTAKVFPPSKAVLTQLVNMQKQFLWRKQVIDDPSRHKISPDLVFTPREAGGLGLIAIPIAIHAQRVKTNMQWLIGKKDRYQVSWKRWIGLTTRTPTISPRLPKQRTGTHEWTARRQTLEKELGGRLAPERSDQERRSQYVSTHLPGLTAAAATNTRSATRKPQPGEVLEFQADLDAIAAPPGLPKEIRIFWGVFSWANNPWIPDSNAASLSTTKFNGMEDMQIKDLQIRRTGGTTYTVRVPPKPEGTNGHTVAKVERWALAILLSSPRIKIGECVGQHPPLTIRRSPQLRREYLWQVVESTIIGWAISGEASIQLDQQDDGIHWAVTSHMNARKDVKRLQKSAGGIIFEAHPQLHGYPWVVKNNRANSKVTRELKRQAKLELRARATPKINTVLEKVTKCASQDVWVRGQQSQTPKKLWAHQNTLTDYQVWTVYRLATKQLNLYYPGREHQPHCPQDPDCSESEWSSSHIIWSCKRAQQFWKKWLEHWFGLEIMASQVKSFRDHLSAREAPPISEKMRTRLTQYCRKFHPELEGTMTRIWWAVCSMAWALLWQIRNQVVHEQQKWPAAKQLESMWSSCFRQLRGVARRECLRPESRSEGLRLKICLECLENISIEKAKPGLPEEPAKARWLKFTEPKLAKRIRLYKEAIN